MSKVCTLLLLCSILIGSYSCEKKIERIENEREESLNVADNSVVSGRFVFSSSLSLKEAVNDLSSTNNDLIVDKFERLYSEGFRSHKPIVNPENRELIEMLSVEKMAQLKEYYKKFPRKKSDPSDENPLEFIQDPFFAAFVNEDNEIIVNDTLYVITDISGMYFSHINDSTNLYNYLTEFVYTDTNNNSKSKSFEEDPCITRNEQGGVTEVDSEVYRYIAPIDDCDEEDPYYDDSPPPSYPQTSAEEILQNRIDNLPTMRASDGTFIRNLFGDAISKTIYFDDQNRIKTEFWDCKYFFYASVGILAKTQNRTLGIWWASKSDELHLGVNRVFLKYYYPMPKINVTPTVPDPYYFYDSKKPIYIFDGTFMHKTPDNSPDYIESTIEITKAQLPYWDFENKELLNIYIPYEGGTNIGLSTGDILSSSNIKKLYKLGIDFLKKMTISDGDKEFALTYQKTPTEIEVLYFGEKYSEKDENKIKRLFYDNINFEIGYVTNLNGQGHFTVGTNKELFRKYTHYEVDIYGMARRGYKWKGVRMIN